MSISDYIFNTKTKTVFTYFYDINGNDVKESDLSNVVAKEVKDNLNGDSFFIRTEGGKPAHHETFKKSPVMNPSFVKVQKEVFSTYIQYLETKKEGLFKNVEYTLKDAGII